MKMGALFWGILLVILGLSVIIKVVFNVDFPLFKVFIAFVFVYIGFKILLRDSDRDFKRINRDGDAVVFSERTVYGLDDDGKEYTVVFGSLEADFRDVKIEDRKVYLKVNTIFANTELKINEDIPYKISAEAVFSDVDLPNHDKTVIGSNRYKSKNYDPDQPYLDIKVDVIFGSFKVREY